MFDALAQAIDALADVSGPLAGAELASVIALRDRFDAWLSRQIGDFDAAALWDPIGEGSMTAWLKAHARVSASRAKAATKQADVVRRLPVLRDAWERGSVSTGQVDAVVANLDKYTVDLFVEHEAGVLPALVGLTVGETVEVMIEWRRRADAVVERPEPHEPDSELYVSRTLGGRRTLKGDLSRDDAEIVETALRVAMPQDVEGEPAKAWASKRCQALVDVCQSFLDHQDDYEGGSHRPHLNVIVTQEDLDAGRGGIYADGTYADGPTVAALSCDCNIHRVLVDARNARIDFGRATRTINADLRTVLVVRDGGCRFPNCDRPATFCDGHHVQWWERGGHTGPDNLVLLCRSHHRTLHKPGWRAVLDDDATLRVTDPNGVTRTTAPPGFRRERWRLAG